MVKLSLIERSWVVLSVVMLLSIAGVLITMAISGGAKDKPVAQCVDPPLPSAQTTAAAAAAPGGGGLRVTEKGFTQLGTYQDLVSLGAIVENTSSQVAYRTLVIFRVLDAKQQSIVHSESGHVLHQEIPIILPGQRMPVGSWAFLSGINPYNNQGRPVAEVQLELGHTHWLAPVGAFPQISTQQQKTTRSASLPDGGTVHYSVTSGYCRALTPRGLAMVFRDSSGTLVGGSFDMANWDTSCQPGTYTERASSYLETMPRNIDESKTQVYPYCDFARASPGASQFN